MFILRGAKILMGDSKTIRLAEHEADIGVLVADGIIQTIDEIEDLPSTVEVVDLNGGYLAPGFIDLQVNGGGGVMLNAEPTVDTIRTMAAAHRRFGTTGFLPTLITDTLDKMRDAVQAVSDAMREGVPGILGIHLEGPHLNPDRKGIHDADKFIALDEPAFDVITSLSTGRTLLTLAPEQVDPDMLKYLVQKGVIVCAGHTAASYEAVSEAIDNGLSGFTHLFNAMSQLSSRAPNAVGAALERTEIWCGIIADGHHVHEANLRLALACKGKDKLVLVTDAMASAGTDDQPFVWDGVELTPENGRLAMPDGRLAGSDLDMMTAVKTAHALIGCSLEEAVHMATVAPAKALGLSGRYGRIAPGMVANLVHFSNDYQVCKTWIDGAPSLPVKRLEPVE